MTTYYAEPTGRGVTVKVDYADVGGAYAGWFLLVVQGDDLIVDSDFNPANGPSSAVKLSTAVGPTLYSPVAGLAPTTGDGIAASGDKAYYRVPFLKQVNARLDRMLGVGHSAAWSATIVESVTPAVIDDNW